MIYDTRYIIEGWHYRLLILDLYLVFVENVSLARRLSAAKSQKDFLRLQKQADRYQKRAYKMMQKKLKFDFVLHVGDRSEVIPIERAKAPR